MQSNEFYNVRQWVRVHDRENNKSLESTLDSGVVLRKDRCALVRKVISEILKLSGKE